MSLSIIRQNFHDEVEASINKQINMELRASYVYLSMAYHFEREDVALYGFSKYFKKNSHEEREHAEKLMKFLNTRGGRVFLKSIPQPDKAEWGNGLAALQSALALEKDVHQSLLGLHSVGLARSDPNFCDFIESEYLQEQVASIKSIGDLITRCKRAGPGVGEFLIDKELQHS